MAQGEGGRSPGAAPRDAPRDTAPEGAGGPGAGHGYGAGQGGDSRSSSGSGAGGAAPSGGAGGAAGAGAGSGAGGSGASPADGRTYGTGARSATTKPPSVNVVGPDDGTKPGDVNKVDYAGPKGKVKFLSAEAHDFGSRLGSMSPDDAKLAAASILDSEPVVTAQAPKDFGADVAVVYQELHVIRDTGDTSGWHRPDVQEALRRMKDYSAAP